MRRNNGFTLVELLISMTVLGIVLFALLFGYMQCFKINEMSQNTTIALEDAQKVIEQMRSLSVNSLTDITNVDWTGWAANNACTFTIDNDLSKLYPQGQSADPLEICVTVKWQERGRPCEVNLSTLITVR